MHNMSGKGNECFTLLTMVKEKVTSFYEQRYIYNSLVVTLPHEISLLQVACEIGATEVRINTGSKCT